MKDLKTLVLILAFCTLATGNVLATKYYVCDNALGADPSCIPGNDANTGLSPLTPWKTFAKAVTIMNSANGGDSVLFARGGAWDITRADIYNPLTTKNNRLTVADYNAPWATGYMKKPIIRCLTGDAIWLRSPTWQGSILHDEGYAFKNLKFVGDTALNGSSWAFWLSNDVDYVLFDSLEIEQFEIAFHTSPTTLGTNTLAIGADTINSNITIRNTIIKDCSVMGYLGTSDSLLIEGCYFKNNGFDEQLFNHHIYISSGHNHIIRNNELYQCSMFHGLSSGVCIVVHGKVKNLLIENNYIHEDVGANAPYGWGISVSAKYSSPEYFLGIVIRGNKLVNVGNVGINITSSPGGIIENNLIIKEDPDYFSGITANHDMTGSMPSDPTDSINKNIKIRNNTILINNIFNSCSGIELTDIGAGHQVVSNIVSMTGTVSTTSNCFNYPLLVSSYSVINNNLGYGNSQWASGLTLAAWQSSVGLDMSSINANPMLVSTTGPNFNLNLSAGSPAINNGHPTLSAINDYVNVTRVSPDIGAYEFQLSTDLSSLNSKEFDENKAYPIPANLYVKITGASIVDGSKIEVIDINGQVIIKANIDSNEEINTTALTNGLYIFKITNKNYSKNYKVLIQH